MVDESGRAAMLERECAAFCRYLVDEGPSAGVLGHYRRAHELGVLASSGEGFDGALVGVARCGGLLTRAADAHARRFAPAGLLRRKLVLLLALLETDARSHERVDRVSPGSRAGFLFALGAWIARSSLVLLLGLILFLPLRAWCRVAPGRSAA
jgi:hypothetical protein